MGQRLTGAKAKIRATRIRFDLPEPKELPERLEFVLEAIYAAYGSGRKDVAGFDLRRKGLAAEAINLDRVLVELMPSETEAQGLLALMLHCEARREARRDAEGAYVPLSEQDVARWSREMIAEAEHFLSEASRMQRMGRFQFEAAIQSAHAMRMRTGYTDWTAVAVLYEGLIRISATVGALVARAAAVAEAHGPVAGWRLLERRVDLSINRVAKTAAVIGISRHDPDLPGYDDWVGTALGSSMCPIDFHWIRSILPF